MEYYRVMFKGPSGKYGCHTSTYSIDRAEKVAEMLRSNGEDVKIEKREGHICPRLRRRA